MWEDRYAQAEGYMFGTAPAAFLTENPWITAGAKTALAVADGDGRNGVHLAKLGLSVTSFDLSPTAIGRANALAAEAGVRIDAHTSDWDSWDWSRGFDLVVGILIQFTGPEARIHQFETLRAATRPGGRLALHGYTPDQIALGTGGPPFVENMYTEALLREHFGDWQIERLATYERQVQEGRGYEGRSALIDLVVRRPE